MVRGTRILMGQEAERYRLLLTNLRGCLNGQGYSEVVLPSLAELSLFTDSAGDEIAGQMFTLVDKGGRDLCLIPEVTAVIERLYRERLAKELAKPVRLFYEQRCYRYERPQAGRYREFTQFGVELLGGRAPADQLEVLTILADCLGVAGLRLGDYRLVNKVKRGLAYYVEDGFEIEVAGLGAQKQVAGGGRYASGIGFALGVDRLLLAAERT